MLFAEDLYVNQKVGLRILKKLGYEAELATNGLEVLAALERQHFDIIFMDIRMPEMDGLEATRQIRSRSPETPYIIALTANAMMQDREKCMAAGMNDFLAKPITRANLETVIERYLERV